MKINWDYIIWQFILPLAILIVMILCAIKIIQLGHKSVDNYVGKLNKVSDQIELQNLKAWQQNEDGCVNSAYIGATITAESIKCTLPAPTNLVPEKYKVCYVVGKDRICE